MSIKSKNNFINTGYFDGNTTNAEKMSFNVFTDSNTTFSATTDIPLDVLNYNQDICVSTVINTSTSLIQKPPTNSVSFKNEEGDDIFVDTGFWGSGNALIKTNITDISFTAYAISNKSSDGFIESFIHIKKSRYIGTSDSGDDIFTPITDSLGRQGVFVNKLLYSGQTHNSPALGTSLPFKSFISLVSTPYISTAGKKFGGANDNNKDTATSLIVTNKLSIAKTLSFKVYLCSTNDQTNDDSYDSITNPYSVGLYLNDSTSLVKITKGTFTSEDGITLIGNGSSEYTCNVTINPGSTCEIVLFKSLEYATDTQKETPDTSALFIDLQGLLFVPPSLQLVSSKSQYYYASENEMSYTCEFTPSNINGDSIVGQYVKLNFRNSSGDIITFSDPSQIIEVHDGSVTKYIATFSNFDSRYIASGDYTVYVSYDPNDTKNKLITDNALLYPDGVSHYSMGNSNVINIKINKQPMAIKYNGPELKYSFINEIAFSDFTIYDNYNGSTISIPEKNNTTQKIRLNISIYEEGGTYIGLIGGRTSFSNIKFNPSKPSDVQLNSNNTFKTEQKYFFNVTAYAFFINGGFDPNVESITSPNYKFSTDSLIVNYKGADNLSHSFLNEVVLNNFEIKSTIGTVLETMPLTSTDLTNIPFYVTLNVCPLNSQIPIYSITRTRTLNNLKFTPSLIYTELDNIRTYTFDVNTEYVFNVEVESTSSSVYKAKSPNYTFKTLPVEILKSISETYPGYDEEVTLKLKVYDSSNQSVFYQQKTLPGTCTFTIDTPEPTVLTGQFVNGQSDEYTAVFSPKFLNFLYNNQTTFNVNYKFVRANGYVVEDSLPFTFLGVGLESKLSKSSVHTYENVTLTSYLVDKNLLHRGLLNWKILSTTLSGLVEYKIPSDSLNPSNIFDIEQNQTSYEYNKTFMPFDLSFNYANSPLAISAIFKPEDTDITTINSNSLALTINLIKPELIVKPSSEINQLYYEESFSAKINGIPGYADLGSLTLYGQDIEGNVNNAIKTITNVPLNQSTFTFIDNVSIIEMLPREKVNGLTGVEYINGKVTWVPNSAYVNVYESVETGFTIQLEKTPVTVDSIVIGNNSCPFTEKINVSGKVSTPYTLLSDEIVEGTIEIYEKDTSIKLGESALSTNSFSIDISSNVVKEYQLDIKFVPKYDKLYLPGLNNSKSINFIKLNLYPIVNLYNNNSNEINKESNVYNISYIDTFSGKISGVSHIAGTNVTLKITNGPNTVYESQPITIDSLGNAIIQSINAMSANSTNKYNVSSLTSNIELIFSNYNTSLYIINVPVTRVNFSTNSTKPAFTQTQIYLSESILPVSNGFYQLDYISNYTIKSKFNEINYNSSPLNTTGTIKMVSTNLTSLIISTQTIASNVTIFNSTTEQLICTINPKSLGLSAGTYKIKFIFEPVDKNLRTFESEELIIQSNVASLASLALSLSTLSIGSQTTTKTTYRPTRYGEQFKADITFVNPGLDGDFVIKCQDPSNTAPFEKDLILGTTSISSSSGSLYKEVNTTVTLTVICSPISYNTDELTPFKIYVDFVSSSLNFSSKQFTHPSWTYIVNKNVVLCSNLKVDETSIYGTSSITRFTNDTMKITGTIKPNIQTLNDEITILKVVKNGYVFIKNNNTALVPDNGMAIPGDSNKYYCQVDSSGNFELIFSLKTNSILYSATIRLLNINFISSYNYWISKTSTTFGAIPNNNGALTGFNGITLSISNKDAKTSLILEKSPITNNTKYFYHEDIIRCSVVIDQNFDNLTDPEIILTVRTKLKNELVKTFSGLILSKDQNGKCTTSFFFNPKTEGITYNTQNYNLIATFTCTGYNLSVSTASFDVLKTIPKVTLSLTNDNGNPITSIDYEGSVNVNVKVETIHPIQPDVNQTRDIPCEVDLRNFTNNWWGYLMKFTRMKKTVAEPNVSSIIFDSDSEQYNTFSTTGVTIKYYPKNNTASVISDQNGIYAVCRPNPALYEENQFISANFTINKYSPELKTTDIKPKPDVEHAETTVGNVDIKDVYNYNSDFVKFNGVINFDEQFEVTCTLRKNIKGVLNYFYSLDGINFTQVNPLVTATTGNVTNIDTDTTIKAIFDKQLIRAQGFNTYNLRTRFIPDASIQNFYNEITATNLNFNIYQSNIFGYSDMYYDTLYNPDGTENKNISKTISYVIGEIYKIAIRFNFDTNLIPENKRICKVELYWDEYKESNKIPIGDEVILTNTNNSTVLEISKKFLPYRSNPYTIKALFIPLESDSNRIPNPDYPTIAETNPLTLQLKPYLTIGNPISKQTYQYSKPVRYDITLNSGTANINPYTKFIIKTENNTETNLNPVLRTHERNFTLSGSEINQTIVITDFEQLMYGPKVLTDRIDDSLSPGDYKVTIYATNSDNTSAIRTDEIVRYFTIVKTPITISVIPNDYYIEYLEPVIYTISSGRYPINTGTIVLTHTNVLDSTTHTKTIGYADLVLDPLTNTNSDTNSNINYVYTYNSSNKTNSINIGSHILSAEILNQNFISTYTNDISAQVINKNTKCSIIVSPNLFNTRYAYSEYTNIINLNATVLNNYTGDNIINGNMYALLNSSTTPVQMAFNSQTLSYSTLVDANNLNKGQNSVVIYFAHEKHSCAPNIFQINIGKETKLSTDFTLEEVASTNPDYFSLKFTTGVVSSSSVLFYRTAKVGQIYPVFMNGPVYNFKYTDIDIGTNEIYAVINNSIYDITSTMVNVLRTKRNVDITWSNAVNELETQYKSGTKINLEYIITDAINKNLITEGNVEFHKVIYNSEGIKTDDLIIGYDIVDTYGKGRISGYTLTNAPNTGFIRFYGIFMNAPNYNNDTSKESIEIVVNEKYDFHIINNTLVNPNLKVGDTVHFNYGLVTSIDNNKSQLNKETTDAQTNLANAQLKLNNAKEQETQAANDLAQAKTNTINSVFNNNTKKQEYDLAIKTYTDAKTAYETKLAEYVGSKNDYKGIQLDKSAATLVKNNYNFSPDIKSNIQNLKINSDKEKDEYLLEHNNKISANTLAQENMDTAIANLLVEYESYYKLVNEKTNKTYEYNQAVNKKDSVGSQISPAEIVKTNANTNRVTKPDTTTITYTNLVSVPYQQIINVITNFNIKTIQPFNEEYADKLNLRELYYSVIATKQEMDSLYNVPIEITNQIEQKEQSYKDAKTALYNYVNALELATKNMELSFNVFASLINSSNQDKLLVPFDNYHSKVLLGEQAHDEKSALELAIVNLSNGELKIAANKIDALLSGKIASVEKSNELAGLLASFAQVLTSGTDLSDAFDNYKYVISAEYLDKNLTLTDSYQMVKNELDSLIQEEHASAINQIYQVLNEKITLDNAEQDYTFEMIKFKQMISLLHGEQKTNLLDAFNTYETLINTSVLASDLLADAVYISNKNSLDQAIEQVLINELIDAVNNIYDSVDAKTTAKNNVNTAMLTELDAKSELDNTIELMYSQVDSNVLSSFKLAESKYRELKTAYEQAPEEHNETVFNNIKTLKENKQAELDAKFLAVKNTMDSLLTRYDTNLDQYTKQALSAKKTKSIKNRKYTDALVEKDSYVNPTTGSIAYWNNLKAQAENAWTDANNALNTANENLLTKYLEYINETVNNDPLVCLAPRDYLNALFYNIDAQNKFALVQSNFNSVVLDVLDESVKTQFEQLMLEYNNTVSTGIKADVDLKQIQINEFVKQIADVEVRTSIDQYILATNAKLSAKYFLDIQTDNLHNVINSKGNGPLIDSKQTFITNTKSLTDVNLINGHYTTFNNSIMVWLESQIQSALNNYINAIKNKVIKEIDLKNATVTKQNVIAKLAETNTNYNSFNTLLVSIKADSDSADSTYNNSVNMVTSTQTNIINDKSKLNNLATYYNTNENFNISNIASLVTDYINAVTNRSLPNITYMEKENDYEIADEIYNYINEIYTGAVTSVGDTNTNKTTATSNVNNFTSHETKETILNNQYSLYQNSFVPVYQTLTVKFANYILDKAYGYLIDGLAQELVSISDSIENEMNKLISACVLSLNSYGSTVTSKYNNVVKYSSYFTNRINSESAMRIIGDNSYATFVAFQNAEINETHKTQVLTNAQNNVLILTEVYNNAYAIASNYSNSLLVTEGCIEFHKVVENEIDEIIGYSFPNVQGIVTFDYKLVNYNSNIKFYGIFTDSVNYKNKLTPDVNVQVSKQYETIMSDLTELNITNKYKIKDTINLTYKVTNQYNLQIPQNEGFVEFHKQIGNIDEIIFIERLGTDGIVSKEYTLVDVNDNVKFYGKYVNSQNYSDNSTLGTVKTVPTLSRYYTEITNDLPIVESNFYKLGNAITIKCTVKYNKKISDNICDIYVNQGEIEFHKVTINNNSECDEIVGYVQINNSGFSQITYKLTDIGTNKFYVVYKNSIDYAENSLDIGTINVSQYYPSVITDTTVISDRVVKIESLVNLSYNVKTNYGNELNELSELTEGGIEIHKKDIGSGIDEIINYQKLNETNKGNVSYTYKLVNLGDVLFYAKYVNSENFQPNTTYSELTIDENKITVYKQEPSNINNECVVDEPYIGSNANLKFSVKQDDQTLINQGFIEFHKVQQLENFSDDQVIGYVSVTEGIANLEYKLVNVGIIKFYGVFVGSKDYVINTSTDIEVEINHRTASIIEITNDMDETVQPDSLPRKVGNTIYRKYHVVDLINSLGVSVGTVEFHKVVTRDNNVTDQILDYGVPDSNGFVEFTHVLTDFNADVTFYCKFTNAVNYLSAESDRRTIYVEPHYLTTIIENTHYNSNRRHKLNTNIMLSYKVMSNESNVNEGGIEFHKKDIDSGVDEIIGYKLTSTANLEGYVTFDFLLVNVGEILFYGKYVDSISYQDNTTLDESNIEQQKIVIYKQEPTTMTDISVFETNSYIGSTIELKYRIESANTNEIINQGSFEFHKVQQLANGRDDQIIGFVNVANGTAKLNYLLVNLGDFDFYGKFIGSKDFEFNQTSANSKHINIAHRIASVTEIDFTNSNYYKVGNVYSSTYKILDTLSNTNVSVGIVEFHKQVTIENRTTDQILEYAQPTNGTVTFNHIMSDPNTSVSFYAKFINAVNYSIAESTMRTIYVHQYYPSTITDLTIFRPGRNHKLNTDIVLSYHVRSENINVTEGCVEFHKKDILTGIDEIISYKTLDSTGIVSHTYKLVNLGEVLFYGMFIDSINYHPSTTYNEQTVSENKITVYRQEQTAIVSTSDYGDRRIGTFVNLSYFVSHVNETTEISQGFIEFHKIVTVNGELNDQTIGYVGVNANSATLRYKLSNQGNIGFYGKFINSKDYANIESDPDNVEVTHRNATITRITDSSVQADHIPHKVGNVIYRKYQITDNLTQDGVIDGIIEFHKVVSNNNNSTDQILGYQVPNNGYVLFEHILTDIDVNVSFYCIFTNAFNYLDSTSNSDVIYVNKYYETVFDDLTVYNQNNSHKLNTNLTLKYQVKSNNIGISEGGIEFHKKDIHTGIDEIISYKQLDANGNATCVFKLVNIGQVLFYGKFVDSFNYKPNTTYNSSNIITVYEKDIVTITDNSNLTLETYYIGSTIKLNYFTTKYQTSQPVNQGFIEFHKKQKVLENVDDQVIGYVNVIDGNASLDYLLVNTGIVEFYGKFINSKDFDSANSEPINMTIRHRQVTISKITDGTTVPDTLPRKVGHTIHRKYRITDTLTNQPITVGLVEFHKKIVNENNNLDQILHFVQPDTNGIISFSHVLTDSNQSIMIGVKFTNAVNYLNNEFYEEIYVKNKFNSQISVDPISSHYDSGSNVNLSCQVIDLHNGSNIINEGVVEFYKIIKGTTETTVLLDSIDVSNGIANITHKLNKINNLEIVDNINFVLKFKNSENYNSSESQLLSTQVSKKATNITCSSVLDVNHTYKVGDKVDLIFNVYHGSKTKPITEGIIEIHQIIENSTVDIVLGQFTNTTGTIQLFNYILTEEGDNSFYAKFINSNDFTSVSSINNKFTVNVIDKYDILIEPTFTLPNNIKLGTVITLAYAVRTNNTKIFSNLLPTVPVTEQGVEIHKSIDGLDEIIEFVPLDSLGNVSINYQIINSGNITFYAIYKNSINYKEKSSENTTINNIPAQYTPVIQLVPNTIENNYILGDTININYEITGINLQNVNEGVVKFYKLNTLTQTTELIGTSKVNNGLASINHKLIDTSLTGTVPIELYGLFTNSINYKDTSSQVKEITIRQSLNTETSLTANSTNVKYGENVILTANVKASNNEIVTVGYIKYYSIISGKEELIGVSYIFNGYASLVYKINDLPSVNFKCEYVGGTRYTNSVSNNSVTVSVGKRNMGRIYLSVLNTPYYLNTLSISATVEYDVTNCTHNAGTVTFTIVNNGTTKSITCDINNNVSLLDIQLENVNNYIISATYNGNDNYLPISTTDNTTIIPIVNTSVYKSLKYTLSNINMTDYTNVTATLSLNGNNSNAPILNNFGYCTFYQKHNGNIINTYNVQIRNGVANAVMKNNPANGYTIEVKYFDKLTNPSITLNGSLA